MSFLLVGDTHYLADRTNPARLDERSAAITSRLIDTLNGLPGTEIPPWAGGGQVLPPRGVIHAGDLIDSGDKNGREHERMQRTEWDGFVADFGLTGRDGRLKFPVFEVHGNHDGPQGRGLAIDGIRERNRHRPGATHVSENGLHYSWDWGPVHFVNLGIVVGESPAETQRRRYAPLGSLDFLKADLAKQDRDRPLVLTHHIDVVRYTGACRAGDPTNAGKEWNPCDVRAFYETIRDRNVAAILYGHTHARNVVNWNGESTKGTDGLPLFNVDNSGHFGGEAQGLLSFEIAGRDVTVRECVTKDGWRTHAWTPQVCTLQA